MEITSALPALLGGPPIRPQGAFSWPVLDEDVLRALQQAYHSGSWGKYQGEYVERLEKRLAEYHETELVTPCASGTFAVELALRALTIGPGDEVLLAAYDYGGNFLSVHAVGARPVLVDLSPRNWNLDLEQVGLGLGRNVRTVIVSHLHGGVVPMRELMTICSARSVTVIEDAAQMPGATIQGRKAGTWGDVGILSFGGSKLLTAGRGGAMLTRRPDLHQRARLWQNRGNVVCPLSELQAAVLLPQLEKLEARNNRRTQAVRNLRDQGLNNIPGLRIFENEVADAEPGYYKLGFQFDESQFGLSRKLFVNALRAEGIALDEGFSALHVGRSPSRFRQVGELTEAMRAHQGAIVLHHPVLLGAKEDIEEVALAFHKIYGNRERIREGFNDTSY
jgi:perosamine synthetase